MYFNKKEKEVEIKTLIFLIIIPYSYLLGQNYGGWIVSDSLNFPRRDGASVEMGNGNILVTGGSSSSWIKEAEIFDYKLETWDIVSPMIEGRAYHKLVRLNNGNILAIGGYGTKSCEIFDTTSKAWYLTDSLNYERSSDGTVSLLGNGDILIAGGFYQAIGVMKYMNSCEIYNIDSSKWIITDSLKIPRGGHSSIKLLDGRVLVTGGFNEINGELADCEIYDPEIREWASAALMNVARYEHSATLLPDGKVFICGGKNYSNPQSPWLKSCELYDPVLNTWIEVTSLFVAHTLHSIIMLENGLLLITGGDINPEIWELYDPNSFLNVYLSDYPDKQYSPLINLLPNGKVLLAGGMTVTDTSGLPIVSTTNKCYLYDTNGPDDIIEQKPNIIKNFKLYQNYPNPFNLSTVIKYELPVITHVVIKIYNILGEEIATLVNEIKISGIYTTNFNSINIPSGVYFYQIITEKWTKTIKMLAIK